MNIKLSKMTGVLLLSFGIIAFIPTMASAHCDTMDGPVISDAKNALENNNINYILKWVLPEDEKGITELFEQTMKVRKLSSEAQELADQYLYENLVRIHRSGEGAPYTGVKPEGTPMEKEIIAADNSMEAGNLSAFEGLIEEDRMPELQEKFDQVLATMDFDVNDVEAGREFVESYVQYTHFAEGEEEHGEGSAAKGEEHVKSESEHTNVTVTAEAHDGEGKEADSSSIWLSWSLAGLFFITTLISHFRKHKH